MNISMDVLDVFSCDRRKAHVDLQGDDYERSIMAYAWVGSVIDLLERICDSSTDESAKLDAQLALEQRTITYG